MTFKTWFLSGAAGNYLYTGTPTDTLVIEGSDGLVSDALRDLPLRQTARSQSGIGKGTRAKVIRALTDVHLRVNTLGGDDVVTIDVDGTQLIGSPITVDGGSNSDTLRVARHGHGRSRCSRWPPTAAYQPGPAVGEGRLTYVGTDSSMTVDFLGLEPIVDVIARSVDRVRHGGGQRDQLRAGCGGGLWPRDRGRQ